MRPTKINHHVVTAFREVLEDDLNVIALTDRELCFLLNESLREEHRISYRTFQRYKARALKDQEQPEDIPPIYQRLFSLFYQALMRQKRRLVQLILEGGKEVAHYKWLLERKFKEWNLRWLARGVEEEALAEEERREQQVRPLRIIDASLQHAIDEGAVLVTDQWDAFVNRFSYYTRFDPGTRRFKHSKTVEGLEDSCSSD